MQIQPFSPARFGLLCGFSIVAGLGACAPQQTDTMIATPISAEEAAAEAHAYGVKIIHHLLDNGSYISQARVLGATACEVTNPFDVQLETPPPDTCGWAPVLIYEIEVMDVGNNPHIQVGDRLTTIKNSSIHNTQQAQQELQSLVGIEMVFEYLTYDPQSPIRTSCGEAFDLSYGKSLASNRSSGTQLLPPQEILEIAHADSNAPASPFSLKPEPKDVCFYGE